MTAKVFIVSLLFDGVKHYFVRENSGLLSKDGKEVIRQPEGFFTPDVKLAKKFIDRSQAELVSASYIGSKVEVLKEGEKLK